MRPIVIEGPTGAGKSAVAMELAIVLGTEIISADSRQVYRGMDIGTAKPTAGEQERVHHHLIDLIEPEETYSAGRFAREAGDLVASFQQAGRVPILAGGTGFYLRALRQGLFPVIEIPADIRDRLREQATRDPGSLYAHLRDVDAESASRLHPNDLQRIIRALEVFEATGVPMSGHWAEQAAQPRFEALSIRIDQPREILYERLDKRCESMLSNGLLDEIQRLLEIGHGSDSPGMKTVGYREYLPYFEGHATLSDSLALAQQHTRNYAKRQWTWYRGCDFDLTFTPREDTISQTVNAIIAHYEKGF